ncbi:DUF397 domain-containing protein [Streptomyces sp. RKCA744]|uniref:DUF397 domain-containing protein n=1 Tax=Streptomyces sp. RKCA744 TaxID=2959340 RepID=UPI0027E36139|nr:DUF397 domain-containing protein [Streptomyces sp. RKCA744]
MARRPVPGRRAPAFAADDHDQHGTVTVLTSPSPGRATHAAGTRVPYGTAVECAATKGGGIRLRESDAPPDILATTPPSLAAFLRAAKAGESDRLR